MFKNGSCYIVFYLFFLLSWFIFSCDYSGEYKPGKSNLNEACKYDTDCKDGYYCNVKYNICSKLDVASIRQCKNDNECFNGEGESLCEDKDKPCKCITGKCKTFNPCENNPCTIYSNKNRTKCSLTEKRPFYVCQCSDNYMDKNGECVYSCNEYGTVNEENNGCNCVAKYKFINGNCYFDCDDIAHSHTNNQNDACDCDFGYTLMGNECIYDCSNIPHSHPNADNNDCVCDEGYFPSSNFCCRKNSTYNSDTQNCECNNGYHLEEDKCVEDTACTYNPCKNDNEVCIEDDNEASGYRCECKNGYHRSGNICCQKFYSSNNLNGEAEECIPDYEFCDNDGDCTNGLICRLHKVDAELIKYCDNPLPALKGPAYYCNSDDECKSGKCIKYDDDDNDESNGYDGYCAKFCSLEEELTPCENISCGQGECHADDVYYVPFCDCPQGYDPMGTDCKQISFGMGNLCGVEPELVINSSGLYRTSNKVSDGYTDNYQASCKPDSHNNDTVFKLILDKDSIVFIRTLTNMDTVIYLKENCDGPDIACNDDISETVFKSRIKKELSAGTYYLFIDSMFGDMDLDRDIEFVVKIIGKDKCLRGSECLPENITYDNLNGNFNVCKPYDVNGALMTKCYRNEDCKEGMTCSYNPLNETENHLKTIGCINAPDNCTPAFENRFDEGGDCCSNYYQSNDETDICLPFCFASLDCPVGYNCEPFVIKSIEGDIEYTSELDSVRTCIAKPKICLNDYECGGTKPFCSIKDNGDGRLYRVCENRNGFSKNIGANCSVAGYNNCYNYACLIEGQGINEDKGNNAYCTAPCEYDSNCPEGYTCKEATLIYPESDDYDKTCKRTVDEGCISYNMKVCVKD